MTIDSDRTRAFVQRACANAAAGRLEDALSDQQQAQSLIRQNADAQLATPQMDFDVARSAKIADGPDATEHSDYFADEGDPKIH